MADVVVHGPVSWNLIVDLDELPAPEPHMQFAQAHREVMGGTSAGKAAHLRELGADVELHTVLGSDAAAGAIEGALGRAAIPLVAARVDGPSERHLNLMDPAGGRVSIYLDVPSLDADSASSATQRLLTAATDARAVVLDLGQPSRDVIAEVAALDVPIWTDLHDYDGTASFHEPFLRSATYVFMNADRAVSARDLLGSCLDRGPRVAVCTLGADGALAMDADGNEHRVPAESLARIVDTNGAGDAFMAGFLAAHLDGADVPTAMHAGARQAVRALSTVHLSPLLG